MNYANIFPVFSQQFYTKNPPKEMFDGFIFKSLGGYLSLDLVHCNGLTLILLFLMFQI